METPIWGSTVEQDPFCLQWGLCCGYGQLSGFNNRSCCAESKTALMGALTQHAFWMHLIFLAVEYAEDVYIGSLSFSLCNQSTSRCDHG